MSITPTQDGTKVKAKAKLTKHRGKVEVKVAKAKAKVMPETGPPGVSARHQQAPPPTSQQRQAYQHKPLSQCKREVK